MMTHPPPMTDSANSRKLGKVILKRGSTRRFARSPITFSQLSTILRTSTSPIPRDYFPDGDSLIETYIVANAVQGLDSGAYFYSAEQESVEQLKRGEFRQMSAYLCLGQPLFGDATVGFFLITRLPYALAALGNRGYRAAQLEGGIVSGRVYLFAYLLDIGASGSTVSVDAVTEVFTPYAKEKST